MEAAVEFYIINGQTCLRRNGVEQKLTPQDRDAIEFMLSNIRLYFPDTMARLEEWAGDSKLNRLYYEYRMVDRFIRCNFGDADFLSPDIEMGLFHFEEVRCPLRGICKDEGHICKPKANLGMSKEERKVVSLYAKGYLPSEIATILGKAENTCKQQLSSVCKKLKLKHPRWLIRLFSFYSFID